MGLFDVKKPLLYREGKRSFIRLQEEIIKQNPDLSIFAWTDPRPSKFPGLLAESPKWFRDSYDLHAAASIETVHREFAVTNQGMRFQFPLKFYRPTGCLVLPLNHRSQSSNTHVGVHLRQTGEGFCVSASPNALVDEDVCDRIGEATIQVSKILSTLEVFNVRRNGIILDEHLGVLGSKGLRIDEIFPQGCWDPGTNMIHTGHKGAFKCLIVFKLTREGQAWNRINGTIRDSFGIVIQYEERQEKTRRWLYKLADTDMFRLGADAAQHYLGYDPHTDFVQGLETELTGPGAMNVPGRGGQQLSLQILDHVSDPYLDDYSFQSRGHYYIDNRVSLELKWRTVQVAKSL